MAHFTAQILTWIERPQRMAAFYMVKPSGFFRPDAIV
jgi:hypothetical protein